MTRRAGADWRWVMIGLAFAATLINYLDRQAFSVAAPILRPLFHLSNVDYSHILVAFMLAYTIMNGCSGFLIDRVGTKLGYAMFVAWWSVGALLNGFATGLWSLGAFRFLVGMGEAGNWPGAAKVVAEWFPPEERSFASGLFNSGSAAGAILGPAVIPFVLLKFGWRAGFYTVGVLGFLWVLAWMKLYRQPESAGPAAVKPKPPAAGVLFRSRFVGTFTLSKVFMDPVWYFYVFWFPEYLFHARHFSMASIGRLGWIPFAVAGLGSAFGGMISRGFMRRGMAVTPARKLAVSIAAVMMMMAIPAVRTPSVAASIALVSVAMAGYQAGLANMLAMPADVFPSEAVASVYGIASMGSGIGGMIFVALTGWMVDRWSYTPVFWMFGLIPVVCTGILWLAMGRLQKIELPQAA